MIRVHDVLPSWMLRGAAAGAVPRNCVRSFIRKILYFFPIESVNQRWIVLHRKNLNIISMHLDNIHCELISIYFILIYKYLLESNFKLVI